MLIPSWAPFAPLATLGAPHGPLLGRHSKFCLEGLLDVVVTQVVEVAVVEDFFEALEDILVVLVRA